MCYFKNVSLEWSIPKTYPLDFPTRLRDEVSAFSNCTIVSPRHLPIFVLRGFASWPDFMALISAAKTVVIIYIIM